MFTNSRNIRISGNPQFTYVDNRTSANTEPLDDGMRLLLSRVVKGAMHNSGERFDAPTCHPETRMALQDDVLGWADELVEDLNEIVTWLYGPAGSGKSAIAQTIAEKLHDRDQLTASFFFSRASGGEGRGAETDLIATLAHQLSINVPGTRSHIAAAIQDNPLVFDLALQDQMNALIVAPLGAISQTLSGTYKPRVIIVDGLDECRPEKDAQRRVVNALISGLRQLPHHTHKLFITSRPEHNIVAIFNKVEAKILRKMELDNKWKPDDDIRTFLLSGFADIRRSHFYFQFHPVNKTWPSFNDVQTLVRRSSGQFMYASVVLKYIKSEENYNPVNRLETILCLKHNEDRPYAELDALYHYIFSQIPSVESVLIILSLERLYKSFHKAHLPLPVLLSEVLGLDLGLIVFRLRPLVSLLVWSEDHGIRYRHASLPDFLLDESRSNGYYINSPTIVVAIVSRVVKLLEDGKVPEKDHWIPLLLVPIHYAQILPPNQKLHIWRVLSEFNVVDSVLCKPDIKFSDSTVWILSRYLNFIVTESGNKHPGNASDHLHKSVTQISAWVANQLKPLAINHLTERIDPWPFVLVESEMNSRRSPSEFLSILNILTYPHPETINIPDLDQMVFSCSIIQQLTRLLRSDLLGQNAMTAQRYARAFQCSLYYLLQLPEQTITQILDKRQHDCGSGVNLVSNVLPAFYRQSPWTMDLYFLLALLYPIVEILTRSSRILFIERAFKQYPFLVDPMSEDYIQASTKVKDALVDLKIKTHLHKVAEQKQLTWLFEDKLPYRRLLETFSLIDVRASHTSKH